MPAVAAAAVYVWEIDGQVSSATTAAQALSDDNFYPFFCFVVCTHLSLLSFISSANQTDCTQLSRTRKLWRRWGGGGPGRAAICQWCKTIAATMERDTSIALFFAFSLLHLFSRLLYSSLSVPFVTVDTARRPLARCTHVHILYLRLPLFNICCCCCLRVCLCVWVRSWIG